MSEEQEINTKVNRTLWKEVGVYALRNEEMKKTILNQALREFLEKRKTKGETN